MSNDFLNSPSRNLIDPLIYHNSKENDPSSDLRSTSSTSSNNDNNINNINNNNNNNNHHHHSVPPSASKTGTNFTGWTPLISKTYFNDQLMLFNSTPNKHFFPSNPNLSAHEYVDYSQGLNLTPFLTHNINILTNGHPSATSNSINQQLSNITPFHDKTLHLADFLMDSPIRNTPLKDLDAITPSKFRIGSEKRLLKQSIFHDPKLAPKRSITQIDTPPRQPHKLSITTRAERSNEDIDDTDSKGANEDGNSTESEDEDKENNRLEIPKSTKYYLQTPSKKVLHDISNVRKTPLKPTPSKVDTTAKNSFQTPAKYPPSSPSTVILSSAVKENVGSQDTEEEDEEEEDDDDDDDHHENHPPSPTPKKDSKKAEPVMGVFSERKAKLTGFNLKNGNITRSTKPEGYPEHTPAKGKNNKARMQAGMNKFQIVFTDVHALMNNKNKKETTVNSKAKKAEPEKAKGKAKPLVNSNQKIPQPYPTHLHPSSQDHNVTMNTSKEISMTPGTTSMNNSHLNISSGTDHSSFEMGGLSSTPNGKFFLDKILEKPSPQSQNLFNQANNYFLNQQYAMLPPHKQAQPSQSQSQPPRNLVPNPNQGTQQLHPQNNQQHPMMMMMMSTPQHQNIVQYSPQIYNSETSPTEANDSNNHLGHIPYQNLVYPKDMNHSPQNYSMINMNGQSVIMPIMMNNAIANSGHEILKQEEELD